jgi:hypothetical protein
MAKSLLENGIPSLETLELYLKVFSFVEVIAEPFIIKHQKLIFKMT